MRNTRSTTRCRSRAVSREIAIHDRRRDVRVAGLSYARRGRRRIRFRPNQRVIVGLHSPIRKRITQT